MYFSFNRSNTITIINSQYKMFRSKASDRLSIKIENVAAVPIKIYAAIAIKKNRSWYVRKKFEQTF